MGNPLYHFEIIANNDEFIGFILWWNFENVAYIEHLATLPRLRGRGYGQHILKRFTSKPKIPILLEVEHPDTEMNRRRIDFYQRMGFIVNEYEYKQPPYKKCGDYVPLMLMTYPDVISKEDIEFFCQQFGEHASAYNYMPVVY